MDKVRFYRPYTHNYPCILIVTLPLTIAGYYIIYSNNVINYSLVTAVAGHGATTPILLSPVTNL